MTIDTGLLGRDSGLQSTIRESWSPTTLVALLLLGQTAVWTLAPALVRSAPPQDVVEGYMWGREWVIATYKHPGLPGWILEGSRLVTGVAGWPAYLVSQLFVAATFILVFLLGRDLMGAERAAAGTLLLTAVTYFSWYSTTFNHNVALMVFWAALPLALWRAVERQKPAWWLLAGAIAATGLYAKLWMGLLIVSLAAWLVWDRRTRRTLATSGPWLGLVVFVVLAAPLAAWLAQSGMAPLRYATDRSATLPVGGLPIFVANVALNLGGLLGVLALAGLIGPRKWRATVDAPLQPVSDRALRYLIWVTAGPLALAICAAGILGSRLKFTWAIPMFPLLGLLAVALFSGRFDRQALRRIAVCAAVLLTVVPPGYAVALRLSLDAPGRLRGEHWPQAEIAARMGEIWARETGLPLRIVAGHTWLAGIVGVTAKDRPSVFTDGRFELAPWITRRRIDDEGMLVVWQDDKLSPRLQPLRATHRVGNEVFSVPGRRRRTFAIDYMVVPPKMPRD